MLSSRELNLILNLLQHDVDKEITLSQDEIMNINWDYFLCLAIRHRIIPQIYNHLKTLTTVPIKIIDDLEHLNYKIKMQNLNSLGEIIRTTKVLAKNNIPYFIVKGVPLSQYAYKDYTIRQAKDIDILIDPINLEKAHNLITQLGYTVTFPTYALKGFKRSYYLLHRHDIAVFNVERNIEIELHFNLNFPGVPFFRTKYLPKECINISNHNICVLKNEYHLLYLMQHAATHAFSRLRWLHDIVLFLENTLIDIEEVFALSKTLKTEHIVIQTLILIKNIYKIDKIAINQLIEKNYTKHIRHLAIIAEEFMTTDYEFGVTHNIFNKMFLKYRYYLVKLAIKGEKAKTLIADLFKIDQVFPYITMPKYLSMGYYILYPIIIIKRLLS